MTEGRAGDGDEEEPDKTNSDEDEMVNFETYYEAEDIVRAVEKHEPCGTETVANEVGCTESNALYRLKKMRNRGLVDGKKISGVWVWSGAEERQRRVIEALRDVEVATLATLSEKLEIEEEAIEGVVNELERAEVVARREVPGKDSEFWYLVED